MTEKLTNAEVRRLKAGAQRLKATFKVGKHGLSPEFLLGLNTAFQHHELIKVKFDEFKAERKTLAPQLAEKTSSHLVWLIGNSPSFTAPNPSPRRWLPRRNLRRPQASPWTARSRMATPSAASARVMFSGGSRRMT